MTALVMVLVTALVVVLVAALVVVLVAALVAAELVLVCQFLLGLLSQARQLDLQAT